MPRLFDMNRLTNEDQSKEALDKHLSNAGFKKSPLQTQLDALDANQLRVRQEASETPLGSMLGISPMNEEEKTQYAANRDPQLEQDIDRGMNAGLGVGSIGSTGASAARAAQQEVLQDTIRALESQYGRAAGNEAVQIGRNIIKFKDKLSKLMGG